MNASVDGGPRSGTTTTLRVDRPDGSATEVVHDDAGRTTIVRLAPDGAVVARLVVEIRPTGDVTVQNRTTDEPASVASPTSIERRTNPYGTTIEQYDYEGLVSVVNTFDDEGRFRSVSVRGDWGEQDLELRPDGARTMTWGNPLHHGVQSWDAGGRLDHYRVTFSDNTDYRWDRVGETGRESVTSWDGRTTLVENADPPKVEEAGR